MTQTFDGPLYYTIQTNNTGVTSTNLSLDITLNQPILHKASEWDVSVIRFVVPNYNTPIFTFQDNTYQMKLSYNGVSTTLYVPYIQFNVSTTFRGVYEIQDFIAMLNNALKLIVTQLNGLISLPVGATTTIPYFSYSETTTLLSFTADKTLYASDGTVALPITLSYNGALFQKIHGLQVYVDVNYINQLVQNNENGNTSGNNYIMTSQQPLFQQLTDFASIVFTSNLPTQNEYIGYNTNTAQITGSQTQQIALPVLSDYSPTGFTISNFHEPIVYNAVVPYRQTQLRGNNTINNIHINAFIVNNAGTFIPVQLPPSGNANIKLMFTKKATNKYA